MGSSKPLCPQHLYFIFKLLTIFSFASCRLRKSKTFYACEAYLAKELLARDGNFL